MADKEFNVLISAETDDFSAGINKAEKEAKEFGDTLERDIGDGADSATQSLKEVTEELRQLYQDARGSIGSINNLVDSLDNTSDSASSTSSSVNNLGNETSNLDNDIQGASSATNNFSRTLNDLNNEIKRIKSEISDLRKELKGIQRDSVMANSSINNIGGSFKNTSSHANKFEREMQRLSMILGGDVPEATKQAYEKLAKLHQEARIASRVYGKYSEQALSARDAITTYALGLDDVTFKQVYMRSQLGLTDVQLRQQANSIKLNARMVKLMGNQTELLTQRMQGLAKHGVKPEDLLPQSTIGQFQLLNETMAAGQAPISRLSGAYRRFGLSMDKTIKGWSAQKMAIKAAQGDMVKYGLLMRGITAGLGNMTMALPLVGMSAFYAYKTMFKSALEADEALKQLAETTKGKVAKALEPVIQAAGQFLEIAFKVIGVVADWITKFNEAHPIIAKVAGAIGFLLPAMTMLLLPLGLGLGLFNGWKLVLGAVWPLISGVVGLIGTASATFLTFAAVIGTVVAAFMYLWKTNEGFRNACIGIWEAIKLTISTSLENIKQWLIDHSEIIKSTIQTAYEFIKTIVTNILNALGEIIKIILDNIKQFWIEHGETVKQAIKVVYETIKTIITSCLDTIKAVITTTLNAVKDFWQKHGDTIKNIAKIAWDSIKIVIQSALDVIKSIINAICSAINGDWDSFWQEVGNITKTIFDLIKNIVKAGMNALPGIISSAVGLVTSAIEGVFNAGVEVAKGFGTTMLNVGKDLIKGLANGIKAGASWVVDSITGAVKGAINAGKKLLGINSPSKLFMQFGEWTTEGYEIGVNRGEPKSTRAIEDFANNSISAFTTTALPSTSNSNSSNQVDNSSYTININAGSLNSERDYYRLAEIIDKKLAEIKQNKSISRGGARVVY